MDKRLKEIANYHGYEEQSRQLIEEMAELTVAINKQWRFCRGFVDVIEEMADVSIMLEQLMYLTCCRAEVERVREEKINRELERIRKNGSTESEESKETGGAKSA